MEDRVFLMESLELIGGFRLASEGHQHDENFHLCDCHGKPYSPLCLVVQVRQEEVYGSFFPLIYTLVLMWVWKLNKCKP